MAKRPRVRLLPGWSDCSRENPIGPPTFLRVASDEPGPLQVSMAEHADGEVPDPSSEELESMARDSGGEMGLGDVVETASGDCAIGTYGTAVFHADGAPRVQLWYLTDGRELVMVTHICPGDPDPDEIAEADQIVRRITLAKPWWKFW